MLRVSLITKDIETASISPGLEPMTLHYQGVQPGTEPQEAVKHYFYGKIIAQILLAVYIQSAICVDISLGQY